MHSPPALRVRSRLRERAGEELARQMPLGYQRMGRVLLVRLPKTLRPYFPDIGRAWQEELGVETVVTPVGPIDGEARRPQVEILAGESTETEVVEHGVRWRFDVARIMFAQGNRNERLRAKRLVGPGEKVLDLFAGIGYFAIPAALAHPSVRVRAIEKNPDAYRYLQINARRNGVVEQIDAVLGDNRTVEIAEGAFDQIFLGWLPSAVPWVPLALRAARSTGATLYVHLVADVREPPLETVNVIARLLSIDPTRLLGCAQVRTVKPYGPGREHRVVELTTPIA